VPLAAWLLDRGVAARISDQRDFKDDAQHMYPLRKWLSVTRFTFINVSRFAECRVNGKYSCFSTTACVSDYERNVKLNFRTFAHQGSDTSLFSSLHLSLVPHIILGEGPTWGTFCA
jgi:hypothetical protein